jgi:hypothetical protein
MTTGITESERRAAEALESRLRARIVTAWHSLPETGPRSRPRAAAVAGYVDHAAEMLGEAPPQTLGQVGVAVYSRLVVLEALTRTGNDELAEAFRYCEPGVIPVMLCAGSHVAMVYLHPAPSGTAAAKGGTA